MLNDESSALTSASASSGWSRSSSPGQSKAAFVNGVVSAPGSPAKSHSQNTRWQAVCPTVAQIGHRSGDGFVANCSSDIAAMTSRRRRSYSGHMRYAARIVRSLMRPPYPAPVAPRLGVHRAFASIGLRGGAVR